MISALGTIGVVMGSVGMGLLLRIMFDLIDILRVLRRINQTLEAAAGDGCDLSGYWDWQKDGDR